MPTRNLPSQKNNKFLRLMRTGLMEFYCLKAYQKGAICKAFRDYIRRGILFLPMTPRAQIAAVGLSSRQLICLVFNHYDGLSHAQIGRKLGITKKTAEAHIRRARRKLENAGLKLRSLWRQDDPEFTQLADIDADSIVGRW